MRRCLYDAPEGLLAAGVLLLGAALLAICLVSQAVSYSGWIRVSARAGTR
jgi:hypothetical protein